ncbi:hypothetical protein LCGC14_1473660 [marine sediment metagenome]|uniref:Uncharacterized protein n=1 Tax=marine sediment metagenome TaxID=412755 RepID=A0A0F9JBJ4_9ZZZZ
MTPTEEIIEEFEKLITCPDCGSSIGLDSQCGRKPDWIGIKTLFKKALTLQREEFRKENELDKADAQILGFKHKDSGYDLKSLVGAMGLTQEEWQVLQSKYSLSHLEDEDIKEISAFLKQLK